jgi:hypothetical protein
MMKISHFLFPPLDGEGGERGARTGWGDSRSHSVFHPHPTLLASLPLRELSLPIKERDKDC